MILKKLTLKIFIKKLNLKIKKELLGLFLF
jgi:hypothetical protein